MEAPLKHTPLFDEHKALGGRMVPFAGWHMPVQYTGVVAEHHAVRTHGGIFDVSHMGELRVEGPQAANALRSLVTGNVHRLEPGQALYTVACNERGLILDDLIVYRLLPESFLVVCNASNRDKIVSHFRSRSGPECTVRDLSDETALLALQGPVAATVLDRLSDDGFSKLAGFRVQRGLVAGVDCTVARTGYTGEDGFEIFCAWDAAVTLFRALLSEGGPLGVVPAGLGARDTLRLEARLPLYGQDIDETTNPYEAGLGWVVHDEGGPFIGSEALARVREQGVLRKLVGFQMTERGIARHGYPIVDERGAEIGTVTSGSPSPTLGVSIGLGYVPLDKSAIGTTLHIAIRGKSVAAVVTKTPFYRRKK